MDGDVVGRLRAEDAAALTRRASQIGRRGQSRAAETYGRTDQLRGM